jgi:C-terminal processing protease CtpA/Prc
VQRRGAFVLGILLLAAPLAAAPTKYLDDFEFIRKTVEERCAGLKPKKIDWAAECAKAKPAFAACTSDVEHVKNVMRLLAVLRDSHTGVTDSNVDGNLLPSKWAADSYGAGLWIGWDKGRLVVQGMIDGNGLAGVVPLGSTIAAIDGEPAWLAMERLKRRILEFEGTSTDASLWASMDNKLLPFGEKQKVDLLVLTPEGRTKTAGATRWGKYGPGVAGFGHECTWPDGVAPDEGAVAKMLETSWCRKLGYLRITGGMNEATVVAFNKAFDSLKGMEACLLDCRWMGGGGDPQAWAMAGRFFKVGADNGEHGKLGPTGPWQFDGPVVMLQNENEVSSAETFTWAMTETGRVVSVGRPTGGWGIIPDGFSCPSGIVSFRLGVNMRATPIKHVQTEGVGWPPDVLLSYGPVVRSRTDPTREIGLEVLRAMRGGVKTDRARELFGGLFAGKVAEFTKAMASLPEAKGFDAREIAHLAADDLKQRLATELALLKLDDAGPPDVLGARARLADIEPLAVAAGMKGPLADLQAVIRKLAAEADAQAAFLAVTDRKLDAPAKEREQFLAKWKSSQIARFAKERLWK